MIRRLLIFLLLFGAGLTLLLQLDRQGAPDVTSRRSFKNLDAFAQTRLRPNGPFFYVNFEELTGGERVRRFAIDAPNSSASPTGGVVLHDARMEFYGEGGLERMILVRAVETALDVGLEAGEGRPRLSDELRLQEAAVRLEGGSRFVPMTIEAAELVGNLATQRFETPGLATVQGSGLSAMGTGLLVDHQQGLAVFSRDGQLTLDEEESLRATLSCQGPLQFLRDIGDANAPLRVLASRNARLSVSGDTALVMEAQRIEIVALPQGEAAEALRFDRLEAVGEVQVRVDGNVFFAERATFRLEDESRLSRVSLEGSPRGSLFVANPEQADSTPQRVDVWGRGPMVLHSSGGRRFQIAGPARLTWDQAELWADGGISGSARGKNEAVDFRAWGNVEVQNEGWRLETPELEGKGMGRALDLSAKGPGRLRGSGVEGGRVELLARDGFEIALRDDDWTVPSARGVDLDWSGSPGLSARAELVEDLFVDEANQTIRFRALRAVELRSENRFLRGDRLDVQDRSHVVLEGQPAAYVSADAVLEARRIERNGDRLLAEGNVRGEWDDARLKGEFTAERMEATGLAESLDLADGRDLLWRAEGDVRASILSDRFSAKLKGDSLKLVRSPGPTRLSQAGRTRLEARGNVHGVWTARGIESELWADEALVDGQDLGLDEDDRPVEPTGSLVASGAVRLVRGGPLPAIAEGGRLWLDHLGHGRLEPMGGDSVYLRGRLPSGDRPYELKATSIRMHPDSLEALDPDLLLVDLAPAEDEQEIVARIAPRVRIQARLLTVSETLLELADDVRVAGETADGRPWSLRSDRTRIELAPPAQRRETPFQRMNAEGHVRLRFPRGQLALAERLLAEGWSQHLTLFGSPERPALLLDRALVWEAEYIEVDTQNLLPNAGAGRVRPRRASDESLEDRPW